jgi:hypothetical protein
VSEAHEVGELDPGESHIATRDGHFETDADPATAAEQSEVSVRKIVDLLQKLRHENIALIKLRVDRKPAFRSAAFRTTDGIAQSTGTENNFAMTAGGGIDFKVSRATYQSTPLAVVEIRQRSFLNWSRRNSNCRLVAP